MGNTEKQQKAVAMALLDHMYKIAAGGLEHGISKISILSAVREKLHMGGSDARDALEWLVSEGLLRRGIRYDYFLTHDGISAVRRALGDGGERTTSPQSNVVNNFHGTVGAIQTGSRNTSKVKQETKKRSR